MITKRPFLTPEEATDIKYRLVASKSFAWENPENGDLVFGASGVSRPEQHLVNHDELLKSHNQLMKTVFPDVLGKLTNFFENLLGYTCYFDDQFCYPGFHIFGIEPKTVRPLWFHLDNATFLLEENYPHLGVTSKSRQITYTCLLEKPPGLTAGLLYFEDHNLGLKIVKSGVTRDPGLEKLATLHEYSAGEMNYYDRPVHTVYSRNDSDAFLERVTIQGHIVETNKGFLFFR